MVKPPAMPRPNAPAPAMIPAASPSGSPATDIRVAATGAATAAPSGTDTTVPPMMPFRMARFRSCRMFTSTRTCAVSSSRGRARTMTPRDRAMWYRFRGRRSVRTRLENVSSAGTKAATPCLRRTWRSSSRVARYSSRRRITASGSRSRVRMAVTWDGP